MSKDLYLITYANVFFSACLQALMSTAEKIWPSLRTALTPITKLDINYIG